MDELTPDVESDERLDDDENESSEPPSLRRRLWTYAILFVVAAIAVVPAVFSATPSACASCHYIKPHYESWSADRHRAAADSCLHCHLEPSVRGVVLYPLTFYGEVLSAASGGLIKPPIRTPPTDSGCRQSGCHSVNRLQSLSGQIRINHRLHAEKAEMHCRTCHVGAGHNGAGGRPVLPPMKLCEPCHAKEMDDCAYCHLGRALPQESR